MGVAANPSCRPSFRLGPIATDVDVLGEAGEKMKKRHLPYSSGCGVWIPSSQVAPAPWDDNCAKWLGPPPLETPCFVLIRVSNYENLWSFGPMTTQTDAPEIIKVSKRRISCDGGGGALGHPKVYLEIGQGDYVECPYCDRRFVLVSEAELAASSSD